MALEPVIAAGGDHDDALLPRHLGGVREWIHGVGLHAVGAVGEVQDPDVHVGVVRVLHDPADCGDHLGDVGPAVRRSDLQADDPGVGSHPSVHRG